MTTIRAAQPTDARFLAWAMLTAARSHLPRGWFDIVLEQPEDACLEFLRRLAVTEARSWWHWSHFHIAQIDGEAAAALCAFRAADGYPLSGSAMGEVFASFGWNEDQQNAAWSRGAYIFTCTFDGGDDTWTIENVATLPQYRKRGLAGALVEHTLALGKRRGMAEAQITYLIGNDAAASAYSKVGFEFHGDRRSAEFLSATGAPGLRRVVRPL